MHMISNQFNEGSRRIPRIGRVVGRGLVAISLLVSACAPTATPDTPDIPAFRVTTQEGDVVKVEYGPVTAIPDKDDPRIVSFDDGNIWTSQDEPPEFDELVDAIEEACPGKEVRLEPSNKQESLRLILSERSDPNCIGKANPSGRKSFSPLKAGKRFPLYRNNLTPVNLHRAIKNY